MNHDLEPGRQTNHQPTTSTYLAGFGLSLILTLSAFFFVWLYIASDNQFFTTSQLLIWITVLAIIQLIVQLVFFLHLGRESGPRWNLNVLFFAAIVVVILVFGSLWIMNNLNRDQEDNQDPQTIEAEIIEDEGIRRQKSD